MNDLEAKLSWGINKGISFLLEHQLPTGEFCCYFSNNDQMLVYEGNPPGWCITDSAVFPSSLIGNSLLFLADEPKVGTIMDKITGFLLGQRKTGSVWNHFTIGHNLYSLCPFDVDDTACVSVFLRSRNIAFPSNVNLILSNTNSKKLFFTWIILRLKPIFNKYYWRVSLRELKNPVKSFVFWLKMESSRGDVDAVVNANVLYYLGENADTRPVVNYLLEVIEKEQEADCDKWYRNVFTVYYFISRNYYAGIISLEPARQSIINRIIKQLKPDGCIGESVLDTALAVCTLFNFNFKGPEVEKAIAFLLNEQYENGSWEKRAYYYGGPKKLVNWGAEELTTGVCLEVLARYKKLLHEEDPAI